MKRDRQPRLYEQVAEDIQRLIEQGDLTPGDQLVSERELVIRFKASRATIRQALGLLATRGVIEVVPRGGVWVRRHSLADLVTNMSHLFLRNADDVLQLTELRRIIEVESVRLAAERATALDVSRIRDAAQRYDAGLRTGEDTSEADWELHMAFCLGSHNTFVAEVMRMFYQLFNEYGPIRRDLVRRDAEFDWSKRHFEILQAVADHRGVDAARLMDAYLLDVSRAIRDWFAESGVGDGHPAIGQNGEAPA